MLDAPFLKELEGKTIKLVEANDEYPNGFVMHLNDGQILRVGFDLKKQMAEVTTYWEE